MAVIFFRGSRTWLLGLAALLAFVLPVADAAEPTRDSPRNAPPASEDRDADSSGLERLNTFRRAAGLPPVVLDPTLTRGCLAHARYLARNWSQISRLGQRIDEESSSLPGFSEEGKNAARTAFSGYDRQDPLAVIDGWLASVFIRPMLLDPQLRRVGWGRGRDDNGGWFAVLDVARGKGSADAILYPTPDQQQVPLAYPGTELPDPIPEATTKRAGYPITITFPAGATVKDVSARLAQGKDEVPFWLSTPEKPVREAAAYQGTTVCLIARAPLRPDTTYTVSLQARVSGIAWSRSWKFTTGAHDRVEEKPVVTTRISASAVADQINTYRRGAGLEPVELDDDLTRGCQAHADYLVRNANKPATEGLGAHDEDASLPGASDEGRRAGKAADIYYGADPADAVDGWMASFYHRVPLLDPDLKRIGFGVAREEDNGWTVVLDVTSGRGSNRPVFYPANGQKEVPLAYHAGERPDPIPESKNKQAGFPITVTFPTGASVQAVKATLHDDHDREVAVWLSTPEKSVAPDLQRNTVCLLAREPLRPQTTYTATVSARVNGKDWSKTWSFTTSARP